MLIHSHIGSGGACTSCGPISVISAIGYFTKLQPFMSAEYACRDAHYTPDLSLLPELTSSCEHLVSSLYMFQEYVNAASWIPFYITKVIHAFVSNMYTFFSSDIDLLTRQHVRKTLWVFTLIPDNPLVPMWDESYFDFRPDQQGIKQFIQSNFLFGFWEHANKTDGRQLIKVK